MPMSEHVQFTSPVDKYAIAPRPSKIPCFSNSYTMRPTPHASREKGIGRETCIRKGDSSHYLSANPPLWLANLIPFAGALRSPINAKMRQLPPGLSPLLPPFRCCPQTGNENFFP